ncbi:MAG: 3-methyladenine DNA glycosylase/8-oxoguanine DNA glycosylase [Myxococcota bacterium]|jgi:3-methyladenine DNA glycosylase/8-oxoguanine DNA glycosylase
MRVLPDVSATFARPAAYSLHGTLRSLQMGTFDPTMRFDSTGQVPATECWRATWIPRAGEVTAHILDDGTDLHMEAWGPGAEAAVALGRQWLGLDDDPGSFVPAHPDVAQGHKKRAGHHLSNAGVVGLSMVPVILQQLVTWRDALYGWRGLTERYGETAPGPADVPVRLPPSPKTLSKLPLPQYRLAGVGEKRARPIQAVCSRARRLQDLLQYEPDELARRLQTLRGIGPWTTGMLRGAYLGDADALVIGDLHMPHTVTRRLTGEPRGSDAQMAELLEPFRPHRYRALLALMQADYREPRSTRRLGVAEHRKFFKG